MLYVLCAIASILLRTHLRISDVLVVNEYGREFQAALTMTEVDTGVAVVHWSGGAAVAIISCEWGIQRC
jgi:hypothetical protein